MKNKKVSVKNDTHYVNFIHYNHKANYSMICKYGMDSSVGLCSLDDEKTITEDVRSRINSLLNEELKKAIDIIQNNRNIIDALVDALMNKNKLSENEISEIITSGSTR